MKVISLDSLGILRETTLPSEADRITFGVEWHSEFRALTSQEADDGYIELTDLPTENSVYFSVSGATQLEWIDFEIVQIGDFYRLVFINELASGGISELVAGDIVHLKYAIQNPTDTVVFNKETFTLTNTDVVNGFVTIPSIPVGYVEKVIASGITFTAGFDYSLEEAGINTRVVFENELSDGGAAALAEGDILQISYAISNY